MAMRRKSPVSEQARQEYQTDVELAGRRPELVGAAEAAETRLRAAEAAGSPADELNQLAIALDEALSAAVQAAYAAQRAAMGPRGYADRIYRRKQLATPAVHALTAQAEHLLTLRETHRLNGIPDIPLFRAS